jgi:hypothetical protein
LIISTSDSLFISGGSYNEPLLNSCSTESWEIQKGKEVGWAPISGLYRRPHIFFQDDLVWNISLKGFIQYRVRFANTGAVDKFSHLVGLWECSRASNNLSVDVAAGRALKGHVIELAMCKWDDEESAFAEIDVLTSTFALFHGIA